MKKRKLVMLGLICLLIGSIFYFVIRTPREITLSNRQIESYKIYDLSITKHTTRDDIKKLCKEIKREQGGENIITLTSSQLNQYLYHCKEVNEIYELQGGDIIIVYTTEDHLQISLIYGEQGIRRWIAFFGIKQRIFRVDGGDYKSKIDECAGFMVECEYHRKVCG